LTDNNLFRHRFLDPESAVIFIAALDPIGALGRPGSRGWLATTGRAAGEDKSCTDNKNEGEDNHETLREFHFSLLGW
jgi:hypothetical protein